MIGSLEGDLGNVINGGVTSIPTCTTITIGGFQLPQLFVTTRYSPGVHVAIAKFSQCLDGRNPPQPFAPRQLRIIAIPSPTSQLGAPGLVDPVDSQIIVNQAVTTNISDLSRAVKFVGGVSADGTTEVLVRVPASPAGQLLNLAIINDAGAASASVDDDGGFFALGGDSNSLSSSMNVTSVDTPNGPMAFAIYRAPKDFARGRKIIIRVHARLHSKSRISLAEVVFKTRQ